MIKVRPLSAEALRKIAKAEPPPRFPRGYFDPLVPPTKLLLDKGFKLHQATDLLISQRALKPAQRNRFMQAMRGRLSRLRQAEISQDKAGFEWVESLFYDSPHLVRNGQNKALCGATATVWASAVSENGRCCRCVGLAKKHGIVTF